MSDVQALILPTKITVAGHTYTITYVTEWKDEDRTGLRAGDEPWGRAQHRTGVIEIWDKLSPEQQYATLLHEVIHCCEYVANVNLGERKVDRIANLLHGFLAANPGVLLAYLNHFQTGDSDACSPD